MIMTAQIIIQIILFGIALSMDAFAVSITNGIVFKDINKKKSFFIAGTFGVLQGLMPLIGFYLIELVNVIAGQISGEKAGKIISTIVTWLSFGLLIFIGLKMIFEGIRDVRTSKENKKEKHFTYKEVIIMGFATSIDALATGIAFHSGLSNTTTIWLHISIIAVITFIISLIGVILGDKISLLFKGKYEVSVIIGGSILLLLAIWIVVSHYCL